jgi:5-methyltetrahydrofolate--homocysteine methyltransferase
MINSISLERDRWDALLPVVSGRPCKVVALCMAQASMPTTAEERIEVATDLLEGLHSAGVPLENIYVDPLVQPVSVDVRMGPAILDAIAGIRERFPEANTICGLSNVSYGLPSRKMINRHFLVLAMQRGLNAAILDPTDKEMRASLLTARMLLGHDEYCGDFIEGYQQGLYP